MKDASVSMAETAIQQKMQAELNLASQQRETINLELSAVLREMNFYQDMLVMWLQRANTPNQPSIVIDASN